MSQKILVEYFNLCPNGMCEDRLNENDKKMIRDGHIILTGKIQESDVVNGNRRRYPKKLLEREMEKYQKLIQERRSLGSLDHPETEIIELKDASHLMTAVWWEGNNVMGKLKVLKTPNGQILETLIKEGIMLGISSRAIGSLRENGDGTTTVNEDMSLISFDIVGDPSCPQAFLQISEQKKREIMNSKRNKLLESLNSILEKKNEH